MSSHSHLSHFTDEETETQAGVLRDPSKAMHVDPRPASLPAAWWPLPHTPRPSQPGRRLSIAEITATSGKTVGCIVNPQQGGAPNYTTYYLTPKGGQSWR